jgi:ubiquinone/menaquinone biosynthesis C-methylase UbiE
MDANLRQFITDTYRKRAEHYDLTANLYYLFGYREWAYRRQAVDRLELKHGDTVVEIGCGTGINFGLYQKVIGSQGRIIGVDMTEAMLDQASRWILENGWKNVSLINSDAMSYHFPVQANGIITTYALSLIPEPMQVLENAVKSLSPGGALALLDLQIPSFWPGWLAALAVRLMKPFAVTDEWVTRKPWEPIQASTSTLLSDIVIKERYFGLTYILSGKKPF